MTTSASVNAILASFVQSAGWDKARIRLTEHTSELDDTLTLSLALHYGRGTEHILSLLQDVFWRLPVEVRINLLEDALWRTGLYDEVPFLTPCMRAIFRIRNTLAHSVTFGMTDTSLALRTVKRGKTETTELSIENLNWAIGAAELCSIFFLRVEGRLGGTDIWGELYGFPQH
jgi:hypothetical protein